MERLSLHHSVRHSTVIDWKHTAGVSGGDGLASAARKINLDRKCGVVVQGWLLNWTTYHRDVLKRNNDCLRFDWKISGTILRIEMLLMMSVLCCQTRPILTTGAEREREKNIETWKICFVEMKYDLKFVAEDTHGNRHVIDTNTQASWHIEHVFRKHEGAPIKISQMTVCPNSPRKQAPSEGPIVLHGTKRTAISTSQWRSQQSKLFGDTWIQFSGFIHENCQRYQLFTDLWEEPQW